MHCLKIRHARKIATRHVVPENRQAWRIDVTAVTASTYVMHLPASKYWGNTEAIVVLRDNRKLYE